MRGVRARALTLVYESFMKSMSFALIRLALAGDVRATFPQGKAWLDWGEDVLFHQAVHHGVDGDGTV